MKGDCKSKFEAFVISMGQAVDELVDKYGEIPVESAMRRYCDGAVCYDLYTKRTVFGPSRSDGSNRISWETVAVKIDWVRCFLETNDRARPVVSRIVE